MLCSTALPLLAACLSLALAEKVVTKDIQWIGGSSVDWPSPTTKSIYKNTGQFISKNMVATRAAIYKDDAFLVFPRYRPGVPMTLARVSLKGKQIQASVSPFPSWSMQEEGNCAALQSVVDAFLDTQGILWVLDVGIVNTLEQPVRRCTPKVVAINAKTGKVVKTVDISLLVSQTSRLQYLVVDYSFDGRVFLYVSDAASRAILVFDVTSGSSYRVILPKAVTLGTTRRDVLYLGLIRRHDGGNIVLFTYLSSKHLFTVRSMYLQTGSVQDKLTDVGPKDDQLVFLGTDGGSSIFFRKEGHGDVYRWNVLEFPSAASVQRVYEGGPNVLPTHVMPDYKRGRMRVLESNFPEYFKGTVGTGVSHALRLF